MIMSEGDFSRLTRVRFTHRQWTVTREEGGTWHAHWEQGTATRDIYAEKLATLEERLDELAANRQPRIGV